MAVTYSPAVVTLQAAVDTVLTRDLRDVPECTRLNELEAMLEAREALSTAIAHAVQVIDAADTTVAETGRSTRCWLTETQHLNPTAASRLRRLAVQLPGYPNLDAALRARKFSTEHAHVILRVMRAVPAGYTEIVETALLELAQHMTPDDLAKEAETLLVACGVESSSDAEQRRLTSRGVRIAPLLDGMHRIDGLLTPETTEALKLIFAQHATPAGDEDDRTVPQRQHDALADVLHQHLAYAPMADVNGERPRIVITIDYTTLERDLRDAWGELPSGIRVSPPTPCADSPATPNSCPPSSAATAPSSTSRTKPNAASPTPSNAPPGSNNTAGARSAAAAAHPPKPTTSSGGPTAANPSSTTPPGSAPSTTGSSTTAAGPCDETPTDPSSSPAPPATKSDDIPRRPDHPRTAHPNNTPPHTAPQHPVGHSPTGHSHALRRNGAFNLGRRRPRRRPLLCGWRGGSPRPDLARGRRDSPSPVTPR